MEEGVVAGLDELDVPRGEGVFAAVMVSGIFEEIGIVEVVTAFAGFEIGDGDGIGADGADDLVVGISFLPITLKLGAILLGCQNDGV